MTIYIKLRQPQTLNLLWRVRVIVSDYTLSFRDLYWEYKFWKMPKSADDNISVFSELYVCLIA